MPPKAKKYDEFKLAVNDIDKVLETRSSNVVKSGYCIACTDNFEIISKFKKYFKSFFNKKKVLFIL